MRFIAITPFVTIVGATDKVCSEDIVRTAESQGFVSSIYNCVWNVDTIGAQACLAAFIDENAVDNAFPITGTCRDAYQTLVDSWITTVSANCPLADILPGSNPVNSSNDDNCISEGHNGNSDMSDFYDATGFFPFRMCTGAQVRNGDIATFIDDSFKSVTTWDEIPGYPICNFCYTDVLNDFLPTAPQSVEDACEGAGLTTDSCLSTTFMINAREAFLQCAGYDMLTTGDMCTSGGVAAVEALIPAPYYTFAQCAYHPDTAFCLTIQAYLDQIEADTDSTDCLACYTELQSDLVALAADDADEFCGEDLFSEECLAYQVDALTAFETCSGFTLSTAVGTVAPSVTTSAPTDDTITTKEATTATTTVAATTTTKSSYTVAYSLLAAVVLCL